MSEIVPQIPIYILGVQGKLRNPQLESLAREIRFVDPVIEPRAPRKPVQQLFAEFTLNGRLLTSGEVGCSKAHSKIRTMVADSEFEWSLVLEDDVGLSIDWLDKVLAIFPSLFTEAAGAVVLLNTDPYVDTQGGERLRIKPSLANSFLVHRDALVDRPFKNLENFEIADWPISFSDVDFFSLNEVAEDLGLPSQIGSRPRRRLAFAVSLLSRFFLSPVLSRVIGVPLNKYLRWCIFGPIHKDLSLRMNYAFKILKGKQIETRAPD